MSPIPKIGATYTHFIEKDFILQVIKIRKDSWGEDSAMVKTVSRLKNPYYGWVPLATLEEYYRELKPREQVSLKQHIVFNGEIK